MNPINSDHIKRLEESAKRLRELVDTVDASAANAHGLRAALDGCRRQQQYIRELVQYAQATTREAQQILSDFLEFHEHLNRAMCATASLILKIEKKLQEDGST